MAQVFETIGAVTSDSGGTPVTSGSSINTFASTYDQLVASTSNDWDGFFVQIGDSSMGQGGHHSLVEIATGAASSEVTVGTVLVEHNNADQNPNQALYFPFAIASGTRISARMSSSLASTPIDVTVMGVGTSQAKIFSAGSNYEALGELPASTTQKGTTIDAGTTINTKGVWVEFDASTANAVNFICLTLGSSDIAHSGTHGYLIDIGTGVADSEVVIIDNLPLQRGADSDEFLPKQFGPLAVDIASGTRIAVRVQSSTNTASDRAFQVVLQTWEGESATFTPDLKAFRFYDDDAGEAASTALAAQDIDISPNVDSDTSIQLRLRVDETGAVAGAGTDDYQLQYDKNSGGFVNLTTTDTGTGIRAVLAGLTNDAVTTNRASEGISDGSGSFVAGEQSSDGLIDDRQLTASNFTEHVYGVEFVSSNVANNDTFDFELSTPVGIVNTETPRATIVKTVTGFGALLSDKRHKLIGGGHIA